jgi:hypothetical protein
VGVACCWGQENRFLRCEVAVVEGACCSGVHKCTEERDVLTRGCWGPEKGRRSAGVVVDLRQLTGMWDVPTQTLI